MTARKSPARTPAAKKAAAKRAAPAAKAAPETAEDSTPEAAAVEPQQEPPAAEPEQVEPVGEESPPARKATAEDYEVGHCKQDPDTFAVAVRTAPTMFKPWAIMTVGNGGHYADHDEVAAWRDMVPVS